MKYIIFTGFTLLLTSCTYSITQVHTEGSASDVIDDTSMPSLEVTGVPV